MRSSPEADALSPRFQESLVYGRPSGPEWVIWTVMALVLGGYGANLALHLLRLAARSPARQLEMAVAIAGFAFTFAMVVKLARPRLVLGRDRILVPHLLGRRAMPYGEVASYDLVAANVNLGWRGTVRGHTLAIHSRRVQAAPMRVFVDCDRPLSGAILARLDRVIRDGEAAQAPSRC